MRKIGTIFILLFLLFINCETSYYPKLLYLHVVGDDGILYGGSYGNSYESDDVEGYTPMYYLSSLQDKNDIFVAVFGKVIGEGTLELKLYLQEGEEASKLVKQVSTSNVNVNLVIQYPD